MSGSATTGIDEEPFSLESLKDALNMLPKIKGLAIVVASDAADRIYTMPTPDDSKYLKMVVVPPKYLEKLRAEFGDRPSSDFPNGFEYPIYQ